MGISREDLAAMEAADREIEETFRMTQEDFLASGERVNELIESRLAEKEGEHEAD